MIINITMKIKKYSEIVDGIIVINKPKGISSNQALQKVKYIFKAKKAGHTGSLDPMATGILPICFGKATHVCQYLLNSDKSYIAKIQLGVSTNTGDSEGQIISKLDYPKNKLKEKYIDEVLDTFIGNNIQIPPMYSALKYQGKRLYTLARKNINIDRKERNIIIFSLKRLKYDDINHTLDIKVKCSKGTYIRVLGIDIGKKLGYESHLSALHRVQCGNFLLSDMHDITKLEALTLLEAKKLINNIETIFMHRPILHLCRDEIKRFYFNSKILNKPFLQGLVRVYDQGHFVAIAYFNNGVLIKRQIFKRQV